jgi:hypothetical protein
LTASLAEVPENRAEFWPDGVVVLFWYGKCLLDENYFSVMVLLKSFST